MILRGNFGATPAAMLATMKAKLAAAKAQQQKTAAAAQLPADPDAPLPLTEVPTVTKSPAAFLREHGGKIAIGVGALLVLGFVFGGRGHASPLGRTNRGRGRGRDDLDDEDEYDDE